MDNIAQLTLPLEACHILYTFINEAAEHITCMHINCTQRNQRSSVKAFQGFVNLDNQVCQLRLLLLPLNLNDSFRKTSPYLQ